MWQQAWSGIGKGITYLLIDMVHQGRYQKFLLHQHWSYVCWWWQTWFIPHNSSGGHYSKSCTDRSFLYMLKNVSVMEIGLFCCFFFSFVLITTDCSLSILVLLLSGWSSIVSLTRWWCPSDNEWHDSFSGTGDLVCIPSALELCGGMCFSDPIWPMLYFVPPVWLLCHSRWVLTLFCEWFLYNHNNCHHQSLLGNFFLCHAREIKHTLLLASVHSSRCFWKLIGLCPMSVSS